MSYLEILDKIEQDFGIRFCIYKQKAHGFMLEPGGTLSGPDCGHTFGNPHYAIELPNGWAYILLEDGWYRVRDGVHGWRQGEEREQERSLPDAPFGTRLF